MKIRDINIEKEIEIEKFLYYKKNLKKKKK